MTIQQESATYDRAVVDAETGEIQEFDSILFNTVVRTGEIEYIIKALDGLRGLRVLDLGCGGGWLTKTLVRNGHNVVGIDVSRGILIAASGIEEVRGRVLRGDAHDLPFRPDSFDAIVCVGALHHMNLRKSLPELARIAKPDCVLVFLEPNKLNPLSAIGRSLFPMTTHTPGERPFSPSTLRIKLEEGGWETDEFQTLYLYAFPLSYVLRKLHRERLAGKLAGLVARHERQLGKWLARVHVGAVILGAATIRRHERKAENGYENPHR
jgi:SAM-dependent methyltransferase